MQVMKEHKSAKFNLFSKGENNRNSKHHKSVRSLGGNGGLMQGFDIPDMTCQGCKMTLFAVKIILQNKFVADMAKTIFA